MASPTPFESADLILRLYELRRETERRRARAWFLAHFNPKSWPELLEHASGERNAWFRMVLGYWDMAASFVTAGAIDKGMFLTANSEIFATFAKVEPFLPELREASGVADFLAALQEVVQSAPGASERTARLREELRAGAALHKARRNPRRSRRR